MKNKTIKNAAYDVKNGLKDIKMKDRWRYHCVGDNTWKIDNKGAIPSPENDWIARIDNPEWEPTVIPISGLDIISILPERLQKIMYLYLWEGETLAVIGKQFNIKRARVCQLVKEAYSILQSHYKCDIALNEYIINRRS